MKKNKKPIREEVKKTAMRQYKLDVKRFGKYLLILIPIAVVEAFLISMLNFEVWLNVIIIVPTLIVWCVVFEVIYIAIQKRKQRKLDVEPKKDIYAD